MDRRLLVKALGVVVGLDVDDTELADQLASSLGALRGVGSPEVLLSIRGPGSGEESFTMHRDDEWLATFEDRSAVAGFAVHMVNRTAITRTSLFAMHAGAVSWAGAAVVLPGDQNVGKTTLTAGLVQRGFDYLSDEAASFDWGSSEVLPYPKPLSLSRRSLELLSLADEARSATDRQVPADVLRPGSVGRACPVRWLIFPRYDPAATTHVEPIGRGDAVVEMARNTFDFGRDPRRALRQLASIVEEATCFRLVSSDLAAAVRAVEATIGRDMSP